MKNNFKKLLQNKLFLTLFLSFSIIFLLSFVAYFDLSHWTNKSLQDVYHKVRNQVIKPKVTKQIVVLKIDEKTLNELWRFPFNRSKYIKVIENLNKAGASVIGFDIILTDKTDNKLVDIKLSKAIKKAWNIVLWYYLDSNNWDVILKWPLGIFKQNSYNTGLLSPVVDRKTQKVYFLRPYNRFTYSNNRDPIVMEPFAFALLKSHYSKIYKNDSYKDIPNFYNDDIYNLIPNLNLAIPLARPNENEFLINYQEPSRFISYSFSDIYNWNLPNLRDKIVLIWATAEWIKDDFFTPIWKKHWVYIHANAINTVLTKSFYVYFNKNIEALIIALLVIFSVYFNLNTIWKRLLLSNLIILLIFLSIYPIIITTSLVLNFPFEAILGALLAIISTNVVKYILEDKKKGKLMRALSEYVSEDIANRVLETTWSINLDWELKNISIFFSDIEWFTTISEKLSPEELVNFLRDYLAEMSDVILDNDWFINKYEWDAIMALWGAFWADLSHSKKALISALNQKTKLSYINTKWQSKGFPELKVRMWIHTWDAILWNIGSVWRKLEFTALWDSVNLASRLEWVNKVYGTSICVSENVYFENKDEFEFRYLDKIRVKWKNIPIWIYELLSKKWGLDYSKAQMINDFDRAMNSYLQRKFDEAREMFDMLAALWDNPSKVYMERCDSYIENPPKEDWDFVYDMKTK